MKFFISVFAILFVSLSYSQQLIINEISQGSNAKEYVEFAIIGNSTCSTPVPCMDLRGVILDDNDGSFSASSSGAGVATGAVRFANIPFWSCIPQGTIIVIYNNTDQNPALPGNDQSMTDANCRLVLPINSSLFEAQSLSPSSGGAGGYPTTGWVAGTGTWSQVAMSNSNDSFQIRNSVTSTTSTFSVSWGNNSLNNLIYFSSASGSVFSMTNNIGNDAFIQANWSLGSVGTDETPGLPNNVANATWLSSMNPQCGAGSIGLQVALTKIDESCLGTCDGTISSTVSNGVAPYVYAWSNGDSIADLSGLCPGTYAVQVSDQNGCSQNASVTINAGASTGNASIQSVGPFTTNSPATQIVPTNSGGIWSSDCGICLSTTGVFDPQVSGQGSFQVCYAIGSGTCSDTQCITVMVGDCAPQTTSELINICSGDSVIVNGQWIASNQSVSQMANDVNGCDSTHTVNVVLFNNNSMDFTDVICSGDSIFILGDWISENKTVAETYTDVNGCFVKNTFTVELEECFEENFSIYIPNVITANADGVNDIFEVVLEGAVLDEGYILNRWGQVIAVLNNDNREWDGTSQVGLSFSELVSAGVYTYVIDYTPTGKTRNQVHGSITVIR